jgi:adenine C2-methylase RlmN of 23S rRNA A2503 and tRNA A37
MSPYQHLPLYDSLYRYTNEFYKFKKALPKDLKHDLGEAVSNSALRCLKLVVFADGNEKNLLKE